MNLIVVLKYASRIAQVFDAAKKIFGAKMVSDSIPLSVSGKRGVFFFGWRPLAEGEGDSI